MLKISGFDSLGWDAEESFAVCLVDCSSSTPADSLPVLLEAVVGWALEFLRLLVISDYNVYADTAASQQATDLISCMAALVLSKIVWGHTQQADHILDLIFDTGVDVDLVANTEVPWSEHYTLKVWLLPPI